MLRYAPEAYIITTVALFLTCAVNAICWPDSLQAGLLISLLIMVLGGIALAFKMVKKASESLVTLEPDKEITEKEEVIVFLK